jgi:hypothetical protein
MPEIVDSLKKIAIPKALSREHLNRLLTTGNSTELIRDDTLFSSLAYALLSLELETLAENHQVTIATIYPGLIEGMTDLNPTHLGAANNDHLLAEILESHIEKPLEVLLRFSLFLSYGDVGKWYSLNAQKHFVEQPAQDPRRYGISHKNRWDEFQALAVSGPTTFLLLYAPEDNAVLEWQTQLGGAKVPLELLRQYAPNSLRSRFAKNDHNPLLGGSENAADVKRQLTILAEFFIDTIRK